MRRSLRALAAVVAPASILAGMVFTGVVFAGTAGAAAMPLVALPGSVNSAPGDQNWLGELPANDTRTELVPPNLHAESAQAA
jgi:hypothetical protein